METFFTGKTVEEAEARALAQLGLPREDVSIEIVEMPSKGFLGLFGSTPAKIRVTLLAEEAAETARQEGGHREAARQEATRQEAGHREAARQETARQGAAHREAAGQPKPAPKAQPGRPQAARPAEAKADSAAPAPKKPVAKQAQSATPGVTAPDVSASSATARKQTAMADTPAADTAAAPKEPRIIPPEKMEQAKSYFETVATGMGVTGFTVIPMQQDETLLLKVDGEGLGLLIGRRGETMEALSHLTSLAVNRLGGDYQKVALDVAGYRSKRENDLAALARRVGAKVAKTGRSYTMEPMNPYERRIIHSTIGKMEGLTSESIGQGDGRRVVISSTDPRPAKPRGQNRRPGGQNGRPRPDGNRRGADNRRGPGRGQGGRNQEGRPEGRGPEGRGGRDNFRRDGRRDAARTEYKERSREQIGTPIAGERSETVNDAPGVSLYGKVEL